MRGARRLATCAAGTSLALAIMTAAYPAGVRATGDITIRDDAHLLSSSDQQAIRTVARSAPFGVEVLIFKGGYPDNRSGFVRAAERDVPDDAVLIAVDPPDGFSHMAARSETGLTVTELNQVLRSAQQVAISNGWGSATVSAIGQLSQLVPVRASSFPWSLVVVGALLILVLVFLAWRFLRPAGGGRGERGRAARARSATRS